MDSSSLGQREATGGRGAEHRTGLPMPEMWRQSWEEKGKSTEAAPGDRKEKVSEIQTHGGRTGETGSRRCSVEEQKRAWLSSCKPRPAGKLDPWLCKPVDGQVLQSPALGRCVNPTGLPFWLRHRALGHLCQPTPG